MAYRERSGGGKRYVWLDIYKVPVLPKHSYVICFFCGYEKKKIDENV